jgi:hypothetical protein
MSQTFTLAVIAVGLLGSVFPPSADAQHISRTRTNVKTASAAPWLSAVHCRRNPQGF